MIVFTLPFSHLGHLREPLFAKRYHMFVEERGWIGLDRPDRLDIDQYDDEDTTYVIVQVDDEVVGGARLRPTTKPHMLANGFAFLCKDGKAPTGPSVYECSRIFMTRRLSRRRCIFRAILLAAAKFCVERRITKLTGITELWQLNSYLAFGLKALPLGSPQTIDGLDLLAVAFDVDDKVLASLSKENTS